MPRYIDAERFKLWLQENYVLYDGDRYFNDIDAQPTADVVEVVRCKDCKWYAEQDEGYGYCLLTEAGAESNRFCAWGERREDGEIH